MRMLISILLFCLSFNALATTPHYAIIIDAGSSGSRLHLFQYDDSKPLPVISDIFSESASPGLSSFSNQPAAASNSLKPLLDDAAAKLKALQAEQASVTVDILATAGMRLLTPEAQQAIYRQLNDFLRQHYSFRIQHIETIPGNMEGLYGWLDINYLANRFDGKENQTLGAIDMGGASTEITFATHSTTGDTTTLTIADKTYTVYSKSYLGLGQDKARESMNKNTNAASCYPLHYPYNPNDTGRFNYASCAANYQQVLNDYLKGENLPDISRQEFIAYAGIYYAFHFFNIDQTPSQTQASARIQDVCSHTWEALKRDYPTVPEKYLATYCANGTYQANLLFDTYDIKDNQLRVLNKVNGQDIDWTLGALLYELL